MSSTEATPATTTTASTDHIDPTPTVTKRRRDSGEEEHDGEDQDTANDTELVDDPEAAALVEAAKKKAATRQRGPNDPWKSSDLNSLAEIAKAFVSTFDPVKALKANKYVMVMCTIPGTKNLTIQDQVQLANNFAQFEEKDDRLKRLAREKDEASDTSGKRTKTASEVPVDKKNDWLVTFANSEFTKHFGFWSSIDTYIKKQCQEHSQDWWGRSMLDTWLLENYNPIYTGLVNKEGKPVLYPQVRVKVQVDKDTGAPQFELRGEDGEVLYRHSCHKPTLEAWAEDDKQFTKKSLLKRQEEARVAGKAADVVARAAGKPEEEIKADGIKRDEDIAKLEGEKRVNLSLAEVKKALLRGAVVKILWNYRGFGYAKSLNKVSNFGSVTKIRIVTRSTGDSNPDFLDD